MLGEPPPPALVEAIRKRRVTPLSVGRAIIATVEPHQGAVLDAIRELGLEWQVIFNKGSVMVLPSGVNKATGLSAALDELNLSAAQRRRRGGRRERPRVPQPVRVLGGGGQRPADGQGARRLRHPTAATAAGVVELIDRVLADDLEELPRCLSRHSVPARPPRRRLGVSIACYGQNVLVAGTSGSGKSTITTGLLERLAEQGTNSSWSIPRGTTRRSRARSSWAIRSRPRPSRGPSSLLDEAAAERRGQPGRHPDRAPPRLLRQAAAAAPGIAGAHGPAPLDRRR